MTATRDIRSVTLEDVPLIPALTARHFHDVSDYERLSELTIASSLADGIPYLPTAQNLQVEMDAADGADPVDDMVLVELDGRVVGAAGVERVVRGDVPNYQIWGTVHPDVRRRGLGTALLGWNLARSRVRASREDRPPVVFGDRGSRGGRVAAHPGCRRAPRGALGRSAGQP